MVEFCKLFAVVELPMVFPVTVYCVEVISPLDWNKIPPKATVPVPVADAVIPPIVLLVIEIKPCPVVPVPTCIPRNPAEALEEKVILPVVL